MERRQVFDLPPVKFEVTEHQLIERECSCGHRTKPAAPQGAEAPVQYGPRIAAIIVYLYIGQFLSKKRTAQALAGLFGADGRLRWVHCSRTGKYTLLMVHPKRGTQAIEAMGILSSFAGIAVHDAWAPYDSYIDASHQLCCAHALRELQAVSDATPDRQWCWATQAAEAITAMQQLVSEAISQRQAADPAALPEQVTP